MLLALVPSAGAADSSAGKPLLVHSQAAVVEIPAQPAGRRLLVLPALEFEISVAAQCETDARPETISISVADTQTVFRVDESSGEAIFETTLRIPRPQLAPLTTGAFCVGDEPNAGAVQSLLIRAALTAQVSLRCAREGGPSMHFKAVPLDIRLICGSADNVAEGQSQDASDDRF
jgi:hypothetical protein